MMDRTLIDQIVVEVLKKLDMATIWESAKPKPDLLIVKGVQDLDPSQLIKLETKWNVIYNDANESDFPETAKAVIFLDATQDLLVKGAVGITDTHESKLLARYILAGVPISLIPSTSLGRIILGDNRVMINREYISHLLQYKETLKKFGVKVESFLSFIQSPLNEEQSHTNEPVSSTKKLLTQTDVKKCKEEKIMICQKTIVTPLARDTARELGKSICVIDSKGVDVHANGNGNW
ncbi:hypothetical protein [Peribacillus asahii]|uniref:Uncharacterized protein n=1 Tax=Peribacillus asahii TaxID=228899 RepID=A0A3Q9RPI0_9BACI|nr:hypothetical protein [Peribacillus asahii]AZV43776.1 hypothetical protein BAOM_3167 [Peribacillus asahii]USK83518.1 hypothetical protein LIT35_13715 [Peribacillus asahii]